MPLHWLVLIYLSLLYQSRMVKPSEHNFAFRYNLTHRDRFKFIEMHTTFRTDLWPSPGDMQTLVYDANLEIQAQAWTAHCSMDYGTFQIQGYESIGQNLYFSRRKPRATDAVHNWYQEEQSYYYDENICELPNGCRHYLQLVWASSTKFGCGRSYCPDGLHDESGNVNTDYKWIVSCHYTPAARLESEKPYTEGEVCSLCPSDNTCVDDYFCKSEDNCGYCQNGGVRDDDTCLCDCVGDNTPGPMCEGLPTEDLISSLDGSAGEIDTFLGMPIEGRSMLGRSMIGVELAKKCQDPPEVINGHYGPHEGGDSLKDEGSEYDTNTVFSIVCEEGYILSTGRPVQICNQEGNWAIGKPRCFLPDAAMPKCPSPPAVTNGEYDEEPDGDSFDYHKTFWIICEEGFVPAPGQPIEQMCQCSEESTEQECEEEGEWSITSPFCKRYIRKSNPRGSDDDTNTKEGENMKNKFHAQKADAQKQENDNKKDGNSIVPYIICGVVLGIVLLFSCCCVFIVVFKRKKEKKVHHFSDEVAADSPEPNSTSQ